MSEKKVERPKPIEVTIIDRTTITTYPRIGEAFRTVMVTYQALDLPPVTIHIPEAEWSPEEEAKRIREDIERRLKAKPEVIKV